MKKGVKILLWIVGAILAIIAIAFCATAGLPDVANKQLALIREGKIEDAYELYTSADFKAATSLEQFQAWVDSYPALANNKSSSFNSREIMNNTGHLEGSLVANDGGVTPVVYDFVKENDEWKILMVQLKATGLQTEGEAANVVNKYIVAIGISDTKGEDGHAPIDSAVTTFNTDSELIMVSAYVKGIEAGDEMAGALTFVETGDMIGPLMISAEEGGDLVFDYEFTAPDAGWAVGKYLVEVQSKSGDRISIPINVTQ